MAALSPMEQEMYDRQRRINGAVARARRTVSGARCWRCDQLLKAGRGVLIRLDGREAVVHVECARALLGSPEAYGLKMVSVQVRSTDRNGHPLPAQMFVSTYRQTEITSFFPSTVDKEGSRP